MNAGWESHSNQPAQMEQAVLSILSKLSTIVSQRFDVDTRFVDLNSQDALIQKVRTALSDSLIFNAAPDVSFFALKSQGQLVGALETQGALPMSDQKQVIEIVELLGSSTLSSVKQLTSLTSLEHNLKLLDPEKNVIRMSRKPSKKLNEAKSEDLPSRPIPSQNPDDLCTVIVNARKGDRFRTACHTHDESGRYAFLKISDLQGFAFQSLTKFESMGDVSIFVEDTANLNPELQTFLATYLSSFPPLGSPFIIFGVSSVEELQLAKSRVHKDLLPHLQWASLTDSSVPHFQESTLRH